MLPNLENSAVAMGTGKGQFLCQSQRKAIPKNAQTTAQLHSSHMLENNAQNSPRQAQQDVNRKFPDVQAGLRKGRGTRDQIAKIQWIMEKARKFQKISISALLTMPKPLTVWITTNCGEFFKRWKYQTTLPAS